MSRRLKFGTEDAPGAKPGAGPQNPDVPKRRGRADAPEPDVESATSDTRAAPDGADTSVKPDPPNPAATSTTSGSATSEKPPSDRKLRFSKQEQKIEKLEGKAESYGQKLDQARGKLPTKKVRRKERVFDEKTGKTKTKLKFEQEVVPINEAKWNKPKKKSLPRKGVGAVKTAGVNKLHSKIYQVEHENVGTQAAHKAELVGESMYRGGKKATHSAYRFVKNTPYRKSAKLEVQSLKTQQKLAYQKALRDNPKLQSSAASRFFQKRAIKRDYAKAIRNAKKSGQTAKRTAGAIAKTGRAITGIVRKNPLFMVKIGILMLIIFMLMALFAMCSTLFSGGTAAIGATTYAAEDADIEAAELNYTERETDLQLEIANAETTYPDYDEYRYSVGDIGHNPFELMGFLTAAYQDFTYAELEPVLRGIFAEQYSLAFVPEVEIRTRMVTVTDPETGEESEEEEEYEWHILNINLTSRSMTGILSPRMNADQREHFTMLMRSKGNRQIVGNPFEENWLPYVTSFYGYRVHPITGAKDYHKAVDIARPEGTQILAGFDGRVTIATFDSSFGNYVVIENDKGVQAKYAHCATLLVSAGQTVKEGDAIATVGSTGTSTGSHLHLEIVKDGRYYNPIFYAVTGDFGQGGIPPGSPGGVEIPDYPGEPMGDGSYAALLAEGQKFIGYPYVFGGSSPSTSFDCSGFICWIINQSGVGSVGRTTAQGLYNLCTPVSMENAKPGDLIFFHSTYSTSNTVTHVGLYIGNGQMLHCGNPIGYASINTNYWQSHFYAMGRLP